MKKLIFGLLLALSSVSASQAAETKTLKIISGETDPHTILALTPYFCKKENLNVELTQKPSSAFKIGPGAIIVLERGDYDMATGFLNVSILAAAKGVDIKVAANIASGGTAIMARPGLNTYESFRGKKVAIARNSTGELMLTAQLEKHGLSVTGETPDVTYVNLQTDVMPIAFIKGTIDAFTATYPYSRTLIEAKSAVAVDNFTTISRPLFSSSKIDPIAEERFGKCYKDMINAVNSPKRKAEVQAAKAHAESLGLKIVLPPNDPLAWTANYKLPEAEIANGVKFLKETKQIPETFTLPASFYKPL